MATVWSSCQQTFAHLLAHLILFFAALINEMAKELWFRVIPDIVTQAMSILVEAFFPNHLWLIYFGSKKKKSDSQIIPLCDTWRGRKLWSAHQRGRTFLSPLWSSHAVHCIYSKQMESNKILSFFFFLAETEQQITSLELLVNPLCFYSYMKRKYCQQ